MVLFLDSWSQDLPTKLTCHMWTIDKGLAFKKATRLGIWATSRSNLYEKDVLEPRDFRLCGVIHFEARPQAI